MCENLPTVYQHYTTPSINSGLTTQGSSFKLNGKEITIYSGALHYFRVPQEYWRDRLRKMRAAGLNTVETYVPWNLHEPEPGKYDFGNGGTDWERFLDVEKFLKTAQEEDLLTIVRPGPYICAEWDFGGLPSWLLRDKDMKVRTSDARFMNRVTSYFEVLLKIIAVLQFSKGGSVIAVQIENEYGNVKPVDADVVDTHYLELLKQILKTNGITEFLFTSDTPSNGFSAAMPGILYTANFQNNSREELELLKKHQPDKPLMVMEYWTGWFDHWSGRHHKRSNEAFTKELKIIFEMKSSVNFYMFHGGTNYGFLNGGNVLDSSTDNGGYAPDTSSYDYDAPLSEHGGYTDKYFSLQKLIKTDNKVLTGTPKMPKDVKLVKYDTIQVTNQLTYSEFVTKLKYNFKSTKLIPMEDLPINNDAGQSYGYIIYRKSFVDIPAGAVLKIEGRICDTLMILVNGELVSKHLVIGGETNAFGYWKQKDSTFQFDTEGYKNATLDLVVENWGRVNFGKLPQFNQYKGLWQGNVLLNNEILSDFNIYPLEFKTSWTKALTDWKNAGPQTGPSLYSMKFNLDGIISDSYLDMRNWYKGIVILNGFVLSRYYKLGPQQTVYVPAPLLKRGQNEIVIFEHFKAGKELKFSDKPIFENLGVA